MEWYQLLTLGGFFAVVLFPTKTFNTVDKVVLDKIPDDFKTLHVPRSSVMTVDSPLTETAREVDTLEKLDRLIADSPNDVMRTLWTHKRAEYVRKIQWNSLKTFYGGMDTNKSLR